MKPSRSILTPAVIIYFFCQHYQGDACKADRGRQTSGGMLVEIGAMISEEERRPDKYLSSQTPHLLEGQSS